MIYSRKNKDDIKDSEGLANLQSEVKQVRVVEKLGEQRFHYDTKELIDPITKAVTDTSQNCSRRLNPLQKQLRNWIN